MTDRSGLSHVDTKDLAQKLYGACLTGNAEKAATYAAVLNLRGEPGSAAMREVFAINCTESGRTSRAFPRIKD